MHISTIRDKVMAEHSSVFSYSVWATNLCDATVTDGAFKRTIYTVSCGRVPKVYLHIFTSEQRRNLRHKLQRMTEVATYILYFGRIHPDYCTHSSIWSC